jgi:peptidoglycan/LPS O-acetylase OafA/YrhL
MPKSIPSELQELTSLRAFAAFVVVIFHMFFSADSPSGVLNNLIADGHLGVDLFFILSGFILTHVYLDQWRSGRFHYGTFLVNRFARVYPVHLFMIIVFVLAYQIGDKLGVLGVRGGENWQDLPFHLLLLHSWGFTDGHSWNFPSWSVSAEVFVYILFPLIMIILARRKGLPALVLTFALFWAVSVILASQDVILTKMMYNFGIVRVTCEFVIGVALYLVFEHRRVPENTVRLLIGLTLFAIGIVSALRGSESLIVSLMAALIFLIAHLALDARATILRHPALIYLGEISYSTYMLHIFVLILVKAAMGRVPADAIVTQGVIFCGGIITIYMGSAAMYHLIELPCRKAIRQLYSRI